MIEKKQLVKKIYLVLIFIGTFNLNNKKNEK